jgi:calcineurin-like phosphoesterase family protein/purple acid phosphatase-like protein
MRSIRVVIGVILIATAAIATVRAPSAHATPSGSLRRYPYLTDLVKRDVTVNWATTTSVGSGAVEWGSAGGDCAAHQTAASKTSITVGSTSEFQWKAKIAGLRRGERYCYRIFGGSTDLLGADPTPSFRAQIARRSTSPFSFAVFGDWGQVDGGGNNAAQADLMSEIAGSHATFALTTGDTAYPSGSQTNYGDLVQRGADTSAVFGPSFWTKAGDEIPLFNAQGNHGMNATSLVNWPQDRAVAASKGMYEMQTYCCANGTDPASYPSSWYAFNAGPARIYVLEASWANSNVGDADLYENDYDAHWTASRAEYRWLRNDLETHHRPLTFAVFHFPLWSDNASERSDPWLHGSGNLEGLLGEHGVDIVFNGHAHSYQRNRPSAAGMPITYVTGGGGADLEPVSGCSSIDAYAIGWSYSSSTHGSACGAASRPTSIDQVFHFLLVTVHGTRVTVAPTDSDGHTFDMQTYDLG